MLQKVRVFFATIFILLSVSNHSCADDIYTSMVNNDSCVRTQSLIGGLINNITTLGLFTAYSANFKMEGAASDGNNANGLDCDANYYNGFMHDAKGCAPGDMNCSSNCDPAGGITFSYKYLREDLSMKWAKYSNKQEGWSKSYLIPPATIRVAKSGDKLCVQFWTPLGYQSIGCKYLPDCSKFALTSSCFIAQSCAQSAYQKSRSLIAISGSIIQCIKDSIERLFVNYTGCGEGSTYKPNYFPVFQDSMRSAVRAALMLYIVLFGIKISLGGEMPNKGEFFKFGAKFILVLYFSVGINTGVDGSGNAQYDDGVTTYMLPFFQDASSTLANIVYGAGGSQGLCVYNTSDYEAGYEYLALWDGVDCRILYYMGIDLENLEKQAGLGIAMLGFQFLGTMGFMVLTIPLVAIFSFQIIFAVFNMTFAILFISLIIYLVNITVISLIAMAILIYMAPVFVPMALFAPTKEYYDSWLKLVISYALQPMIVTAYIAMMLTIFDQTMFGDCQFTSQNIEVLDEDTTSGTPPKFKPWFKICDPDNLSAGCATSITPTANTTPCKETFGYKVNQSPSAFTETKSAIFFNITQLTNNAVGDLMASLTTLVLFGYLFYKFSEVLSQFAAELTGGTNIGALAGRPTQFFDKVMEAAGSKLSKGPGGKGWGKKPGGGDDKGSGAQAETKRPGGGDSGADVSTG